MKTTIVAVAMFLLVGCKGGPRSQGRIQVIPIEKQDKAAKFVLECVEAATAKQTVENQDADAFVRACRGSAEELYGVWVPAEFWTLQRQWVPSDDVIELEVEP